MSNSTSPTTPSGGFSPGNLTAILAEPKPLRQYIALVGKKFLNLFRVDQLPAEPCKGNATFKGTLRAPLHCCRPCLDKYLDNRKAKGEQVEVMPDGWKPF